MSAIVQAVRTAFGGQADVLADFGLAPKKARAPLTVEQMAAAAAKRKATRAARGTTSKKASKKGIKGAVTGIVVTPIVAGAPVVQATPTALHRLARFRARRRAGPRRTSPSQR